MILIRRVEKGDEIMNFCCILGDIVSSFIVHTPIRMLQKKAEDDSPIIVFLEIDRYVLKYREMIMADVVAAGLVS